MKKSLGNKRNKVGDPADDPREPDQIGEVTRIHGNFQDGETRTFTVDRKQKELVVSKVFDNADFGFSKITVERPLRLNFQASAERIARLELESGFRALVLSQKKSGKARLEEIEQGKRRQEGIRSLLREFGKITGERLFKDRAVFLSELKALDVQGDEDEPIQLSSSVLKAIQNALGERDETAEICYDKHGEKEPDPDLRDTESVPLKESIEEYFKREVRPHVPDAWIDQSKTKVGYEIPLNRHFYVYEPPRPLEDIEAEIKILESEIVRMLGEVTA
jgi:type I restriction enzyme M protein